MARERHPAELSTHVRDPAAAPQERTARSRGTQELPRALPGPSRATGPDGRPGPAAVGQAAAPPASAPGAAPLRSGTDRLPDPDAGILRGHLPGTARHAGPRASWPAAAGSCRRRHRAHRLSGSPSPTSAEGDAVRTRFRRAGSRAGRIASTSGCPRPPVRAGAAGGSPATFMAENVTHALPPVHLNAMVGPGPPPRPKTCRI